MSKTTNKFSPEVRERAVRMVTEQQGEHASRWAAIVSIAAKIGCAPHTLNDWLNKADVARISPLAFKHINFLGRYAFDLKGDRRGRSSPAPQAYFRIGLSHSLMPVHRPVQTHGPIYAADPISFKY